jgi:hypothetical protein
LLVGSAESTAREKAWRRAGSSIRVAIDWSAASRLRTFASSGQHSTTLLARRKKIWVALTKAGAQNLWGMHEGVWGPEHTHFNFLL